MKKQKNFLSLGLGLIIFVITVFGFMSTTLTSCDPDSLGANHCKPGYPLYCSSVKVCCPAGKAYYCDGGCYSSPCSGGTVTVDSCEPE